MASGQIVVLSDFRPQSHTGSRLGRNSDGPDTMEMNAAFDQGPQVPKAITTNWFWAALASFTMHALFIYGVSGLWRTPPAELSQPIIVDLLFESAAPAPAQIAQKTTLDAPAPADKPTSPPVVPPLQTKPARASALETVTKPKNLTKALSKPEPPEAKTVTKAPAKPLTQAKIPKVKAAIKPKVPAKPSSEPKASASKTSEQKAPKAKTAVKSKAPAKPLTLPKTTKIKTAAKAKTSPKALIDPIPTEATTSTQPLAIHRNVPYLDRAVSPAAALAMRAVRQFEPRIGREDMSHGGPFDDRRARAAVRAVARYRRAADQGYVMASYNLARALAEGRGVKRDYPGAVQNFRIASRLGNVPAMLRLADLNLAGLGVPENRIEAQALYYVAASMGSLGAARANALLSKHLDNKQLQQAHKRARNLRAEIKTVNPIQQQGKEQDLLAAAAQGDIALVRAMAAQGIDANAVNGDGRTAVVTAAWRGHERIVQVLLDTGVEIDVADNRGRTALSWAAINGYPKIVKTLLREEAMVDVRDDQGMTPLIRAAWNGHQKIVAALIAATANVNAADNRGITALQRAETQDAQGIIAMLRAAGAR
jgi:hypothetical protein